MAKLSSCPSLILLHLFILLHLESGECGVHAQNRTFSIEFRAEEVVIDEQASKVKGSPANNLFNQVVAVIRGGFPNSTYPLVDTVRTSKAEGVRIFVLYRMK